MLSRAGVAERALPGTEPRCRWLPGRSLAVSRRLPGRWLVLARVGAASSRVRAPLASVEDWDRSFGLDAQSFV